MDPILLRLIPLVQVRDSVRGYDGARLSWGWAMLGQITFPSVATNAPHLPLLSCCWAADGISTEPGVLLQGHPALSEIRSHLWWKVCSIHIADS